MKNKLSKEEKEILDSYEAGEWKEVTKAADLLKYSKYAKETFRKNKRVNIRISQKDLDLIRRKACEEGMPYQTLIASLIHKYSADRLVDREKLLVR